MSGWRKGRLIYQFLGLEPENTEYQKTIADQTTGRTYRFDSSYDNGKIKYLDEVKSGYVSGQSYESKALEYQRIASQQGATLRYFFYGEASGPFKNFLNPNLIYWEQY